MRLAKYHGLGNNFIIMEYINNEDYSKYAIKYCDVKTGIGADGLIVVKKDPLEMIFYNCDGSRATMCGNGIRCFAAYCYDEHITEEMNYDVLTLAGIMKVNVKSIDPFMVEINMGKPVFDKDLLHLSKDVDLMNIKLYNHNVYSVFMGTVHSVIFVDDLKDINPEELGKSICNDELFMEKTNVNMVMKLDNNNFKMITYERGVGITSACGTGCCAAYVIGTLLGKCNDFVNVHLEYGYLRISMKDDFIMMQGEAKKIASIIWEG